jgi:hypothetical protein
VAHVIDSWQPDAVFIDVGNGSGVIDRLRQLGHDVQEINFGSRSSTGTHANKRTEMWFAMRDWINQGGAIPNDVSLKQDLGAPVYWYDNANRLMLEPKDDIKARGLPSPDLGDALALTFAMPVGKRIPRPAGGAARPLDYDPLRQVDGFLTSKPRDYDPLESIR